MCGARGKGVVESTTMESGQGVGEEVVGWGRNATELQKNGGGRVGNCRRCVCGKGQPKSHPPNPSHPITTVPVLSVPKTCLFCFAGNKGRVVVWVGVGEGGMCKWGQTQCRCVACVGKATWQVQQNCTNATTKSCPKPGGVGE